MLPVYQKELDFAIALLKRLRLPVRLLCPWDSLTAVDLGLREKLGLHAEYETLRCMARNWSEQSTIYKLLDGFGCSYIYFQLPNQQEPTAVVIGPYLTGELSREMLLEQTERLGLPLRDLPVQQEYYAALPVINDPSVIMAVLTCLGERIWGRLEAFHMVDVNIDQASVLPAGHRSGESIEQEDILQTMKRLEERYAYENELMEIVSKGLTHQAESLMSNVSSLNYPSRTADPLRNMKNYCIICNTLLRKSAQRGGVHPFYLDRISSQYAQRIEAAPTLEKASALISGMIRNYCRLVHTHADKQYAAIVQKLLTYIDANLSGDLSLNHLAGLMRVSPAYLSTLFHRETGHTLLEHINTQRMKAALQLLNNTRLQIQTISQLTGFADPNYFSRLFRRFYGISPLLYRKKHFSIPAPGER